MSDVPRVDQEELPSQRVGRATAIRGRAEPRVDPSARPRGRILRIHRAVEVGLLVADERAIGRVAAVAARRPSRLPEDLVAAEEREVHPGVSRCLDVVAHPLRPVLVVGARDEELVVLEQGAVGVNVGFAGIADVVAVGFDEADELVFGIERIRLTVVRGEGPVERAVVRHGVGGLVRLRIAWRTRDRARVEAVPTVGVVGLPGRVGGLQQDVRSDSSRRGQRRRSGSRRPCRRARDARCKGLRRRRSARSRKPTPPSCRSRRARWRSSSGTMAGSEEGLPTAAARRR